MDRLRGSIAKEFTERKIQRHKSCSGKFNYNKQFHGSYITIATECSTDALKLLLMHQSKFYYN